MAGLTRRSWAREMPSTARVGVGGSVRMSQHRRRNAFIYTIPLHRANISMYLLLELMTVLWERSEPGATKDGKENRMQWKNGEPAGWCTAATHSRQSHLNCKRASRSRYQPASRQSPGNGSGRLSARCTQDSDARGVSVGGRTTYAAFVTYPRGAVEKTYGSE
jgi:hypothetical protein